MPMVDQLAGYRILERINESLLSIIYRAQKADQNKTVIIKALKTEHPSAADIARLKHEFKILQGIDLEGIIRPIEVLEWQGRVYLILEDFRATPLKAIIKNGLSVERFLELSVILSETMGKLHQLNITHRDIKPSNILVSPEGDVLKITDFGIAAEITGQYEEIYNPSVMEGTLPYMSPEQTGRMNCAVDYRSDLYSLGITFYEMLCGQVPFMSDDPMDIIHAHIAKVPTALTVLNREIPEQISNIIMKLLAKAPEERYQNGFGLLSDLQECLTRLRASARIEPFPVGQHDVSLRFIIPRMLVGRENELAILFGAFERLGSGTAEMLLVAGEPGIGKSALVNEIHKPIVQKRGYFITGKYEEFRRYVPYSAIIQAFQGLAHQLLSETEERVREWKDSILKALGPNGKIITDAIPEIELIIGKQPDIPEVGPEESQNRFNLIFKNFIRVFAVQEHPLVLFLDDLQRADSASLNLIQTIMTDKELKFLFFIGAYRDTEVPAHHPFMLIKDAIQKSGTSVATIALGTLKMENVNQLIACFLRCPPDASRPLSQAIHTKTTGNPFFVNQFLKTLYDEHHIVLDPERGWTWDLQKIEEMQVTDNVVEFMAAKLSDLPKTSLDLLRICACIGNRFDVETLAVLTARPMGEILSIIDSLIQEGFINLKGNFYRFHHDRIQEAAYSLIPPDERERIHLRIGMLDLERTSPEEFFIRIFYIVDQLNQGRRLMKTQEERTRLADMNLKAGIKAKDALAYQAAVNYLSTGMDLLSEGSWRTEYALTYGLHIQLMECHYLNRDFDEAERLFEVIIRNATNRKDIASAYNTMIVLYINLRSPMDAIQLGIKAMKIFDIHIPQDVLKVGVGSVLSELIWVKLLFLKVPLEKYIDLPLMQDEERLVQHQIGVNVGTATYYINPNLFAFLTLNGIKESLLYGIAPNTAASLMAYATIIQTALGDYEQGYRIGELALKLNERLDNRKIAGLVHHIFAFCIQHWKKHARHDLDLYRKVYQYSLYAGDFTYAGHSVNASTDTRLMLGYNLDDILEDIRKYEELMNIVKNPFITARYRENIQFIMTLAGQTENRNTLSGEGYDEADHIEQLHKDKNFFGLCYTLLYKLKLLYLYGSYEDARQKAEELEQYIKTPVGTLMIPEYYFYYSLTLTALLKSQPTVSKRKYEGIIHRNQRKMKGWAGLCPDNFRHKYDLVEAEMAAVHGLRTAASDLYHAAIKGALNNGYLHEEALGYELASGFYASINYEEEARTFLIHAHQCYLRWGAMSKVKALQKLHPFLAGLESKYHSAETRGDVTTTTGTSTSLLDLSTVMQVSQAISGEIVLERLLQKVMHMSIANAGAQRGFLILESDGKLFIEASEEVDREESSVLQSIPLETSENLCPSIVNYVFRSGKNLILDHAVEEGAFMNDPYIVRNRCKSILCTPIMNKGKLMGILYMENNLATHAFTAERLDILGIISSQAAISLENAKLFELATTDGLTKLFVHRYFQLLLDQEILRCGRYYKTCSLIMMDIDNFKLCNDTYGHQLGDEVLRNVARTIKKNIRANDVAARYGGEEFILILPETELATALIVAEKIRKAVEDLHIVSGSQDLNVTISLGVAVLPLHAGEKETLIKCADDALYVAKHTGKNCVSVGKKQSL